MVYLAPGRHLALSMCMEHNFGNIRHFLISTICEYYRALIVLNFEA